MLFGQIDIDAKFSYKGQKWIKIEKCTVPIGTVNIEQNMKLDWNNESVLGFLADNVEVEINTI